MSDAQTLVDTLATELLNPIVGVMFAAAVVYFVFGVVNYIANADSEQARRKGRKHLMYSIVGLVVMSGVWGIIGIIFDSLNMFGNVDPPQGYNL